MKRGIMIALFLTLVVGISVSAADINPPPAIYMPWGGKLVMELNVSDDDVLGIVKQAIPALADVIQDINQSADPRKADFLSGIIAAAGEADLQSLSSAIEGITNVRVVEMKYSRKISAESFIDEFTKGVAKSGPYKRVLMDIAHTRGATASYMLPDNAGFIGFAYIPQDRTAYAVRVVGGINVEDILKFAGSITKAVISHSQTPGEPEDSGEEPEQE